LKKELLHIFGHQISKGESAKLSFSVAKLHTQNSIDIPVIIERSRQEGPTVLITAGIHGDEVNGVEVVRQLIAKGINKPKRGTIICIPLINVYGFLRMNREFPDGRDLNRVFPGSKTGSLASRVAYKLMKEIIPKIDLAIDFHTGGASRFNAPQIRITDEPPYFTELAKVFGAPFIVYSKHKKKTFRNACQQQGIPILLFEGGKSFYIDKNITNTAVNGVKRFLHHQGMLRTTFKVNKPKQNPVKIKQSKWIRAKHSGMFTSSVRLSTFVEKGSVLGNITDPYGNFNHFIKAPNSGFIFNINESPMIYQGDAIFHISLKTEP